MDKWQQITFLFFGLTCLFPVNAAARKYYYYPSIIWDPLNPLFACERPQIKAKTGDYVYHDCAQGLLMFGRPASDRNAFKRPKVKVYYLKDRLQYENCNVTDAVEIRSCPGFDESLNTLAFFDLGIANHKLGETLYFIGTENGRADCTTNGRYGKNGMRLELSICTWKEEAEGKCDICHSPGCYYKDCGTITCSNWSSLPADSKFYERPCKCRPKRQRSCKNSILGNSYIEYDYSHW